jgi:SNF2 family DNA or RNA helicase
MLVAPRHKALILNLKQPERVSAVIPAARPFVHRGRRLLAVPHSIDACHILANLGMPPPSPILYYYSWGGRFTPFAHQKETAEFLTRHRRAYLLDDMGAGKTLSTLWAYHYLKQAGVLHRALIVTPLSTIERVWADEIFGNFPDLDFAVLTGPQAKRLARLDESADIYIINHDGIKVRGIEAALAKRPDIDLVVVDELAQVGRKSGTARFQTLQRIVNKQHPRWCWGLTGAPIPNSPTDAWTQCRIVTPETVSPYFNRFRERVMRQCGPFVWAPRADALQTVHASMQPAIRHRREDCIDLPERIFTTRHVPLTAEQQAAYDEMRRKLVAEVESGKIVAVNDGVKALKLVQICSGSVFGDDRQVHELDVEPRLEAVREAIEQAEAKVIVFAPFVANVARLVTWLNERGISAEAVHGSVAKGSRDRIFSRFVKSGYPRVLVAQPAAMSHGLTLTSANVVVWYAPIPSNDIFEQANARITRIGQKRGQVVLTIEGADIERLYYSRLRSKQRVQGLLLDYLRNGAPPACNFEKGGL